MSNPKPAPIFRLPRSRSFRVFSGLLGLAIFSAGAVVEYVVLKDEEVRVRKRGGVEQTLTRAERWPAALLSAVVMAIAPALAIANARTTALEIGEDGIKLEGQHRNVFSWDRIESCHWGRHRPGTLNIHGADGLAFVDVAEPYRPAVESAIRRFDRWRD